LDQFIKYKYEFKRLKRKNKINTAYSFIVIKYFLVVRGFNKFIGNKWLKIDGKNIVESRYGNN
jgi:hypothetical protein